MQAGDLPQFAQLARAKMVSLVHRNRTIFDKEIDAANYELAEQIFNQLYKAIMCQEPFEIYLNKNKNEIQWRAELTKLTQKINLNLIKAKLSIDLGHINEQPKHYQVQFYLGFLVE
jgi:hypothetical protein